MTFAQTEIEVAVLLARIIVSAARATRTLKKWSGGRQKWKTRFIALVKQKYYNTNQLEELANCVMCPAQA